ncbi:hypothetical protein DSLASN_03640 [Desulfoluna limicola]|uniref:Uncharacterized protein n=1 Tax=Desulfoluna limicola TaxID=2810562 RepID=A0ABM7PCA3_9BACT|nr:hypothetical protein DSLASN_03640 [Desulfoluna limicola]
MPVIRGNQVFLLNLKHLFVTLMGLIAEVKPIMGTRSCSKGQKKVKVDGRVVSVPKSREVTMWRV